MEIMFFSYFVKGHMVKCGIFLYGKRKILLSSNRFYNIKIELKTKITKLDVTKALIKRFNVRALKVNKIYFL